MAPHRPSAGASCLASALVHGGPIRFIGLVALLSGIASHVTSGALSQSVPRPRVAHLSPPPTATTPPPTLPPPTVETDKVQEGNQEPSNANATDDLTAEGRRPPPILSDSILDMIDTEQVDRVLAKKRREEELARGRAHDVDTRHEGRQASSGRDRGHRRGSNGREERLLEDEGFGRGHEGRRDKSNQRRIHRGKRPANEKRAGHRDGPEGRHRVSLSRLAKWLDISPIYSYPVPDSPIPASPEPMPPARDSSREKILKSSKDALVVTRREYLRKDWCRTEPLIQRIKIDGCLTRSMVNGFCYGQCNSFYIPRSPKEIPASNTSLTMSGGHDFIRNKLGPLSSIPILYTQAFMSCSFCKPKEVTWVTISLRCPSIKPAQLTLRRRVERIKQCKCISEVLN
ncbi:uncharacterized protein LOC124157897 [Ischnura elegans]|uniref:uncharacterized protein LOC124157897 n=1 Tax=Ischnura elegans TaxID=197161 RepID=UPI001ED892CB|nr:uncharacterized protein LOC124157897 [Ischnura elegans]